MTLHNIFVYGTLLKGLENSHRLQSSKYLGKAVTTQIFYMVSNENNGVVTSSRYEPTKQLDDDVELYKYPYLLKVPVAEKQEGSQIVGEVYEVDDTVLSELDALEDHPNTYIRQPIAVLPTGTVTGSLHLPLYDLRLEFRPLHTHCVGHHINRYQPHSGNEGD